MTEYNPGGIVRPPILGDRGSCVRCGEDGRYDPGLSTYTCWFHQSTVATAAYANQALRNIGVELAKALRLYRIVKWLNGWLGRQQWAVWLDARLPTFPPWWRVWIWCGYAYVAVVAVAFLVAYVRGWRP